MTTENHLSEPVPTSGAKTALPERADVVELNALMDFCPRCFRYVGYIGRLTPRWLHDCGRADIEAQTTQSREK